jgi:hypothetical protein
MKEKGSSSAGVYWPMSALHIIAGLCLCAVVVGCTPLASSDTNSSPVKAANSWKKGAAIYRDRNHDGKIDWEVSGETWRYDGVDTYRVDTNYDGFYDLEYSAGGIAGKKSPSKAIHDRVSVVGKDFVPIEKPNWVE